MFPRRSLLAIACSAVRLLATAGEARAAGPPPQAPPSPPVVVFGADQIHFDPGSRTLEASGHVHVDEPPFHLVSEGLTLRRVPIGAQLEGDGTVVFCPCLGSPLAVRFRGATVAPPHDLVLRSPTLEVFGVPIAWAPAFWLRSPGRVGLLPPDVTWRGADGAFLGGGVHLPWREGDVSRGLDLRGGAYLEGGVAASARLRTTASDTDVGWDRLRGADGLRFALRGATAIEAPTRPESAAWAVDALRGARAVEATTDVDAAARPFDRGAAQVVWQEGGWLLASGVRSAAARGGPWSDPGVGGPVMVVRRSDAIARAGSYDATAEGGALVDPGAATTTFLRAEAGALLATRIGAAGVALTTRAAGVAADDGTRSVSDGAAQARVGTGVPLARAYPSIDAADPWVHQTEPRVEIAALASHESEPPIVPAGRGAQAPSGAAWVAAAGWSNALGRWGSRASVRLDAWGAIIGGGERIVPAVRARVAGAAVWAAASADFARVLLPAAVGGGGVLVASARLGPERALYVSAHVAERDGVDPIVARLVIDAPLEPASGFLDAPGWTGGARVGVPFGSRLTARAGADADLDAGQLVAAVAAVELHDPCGCVILRATASHRLGRDGVDAWISVDVTR